LGVLALSAVLAALSFVRLGLDSPDFLSALAGHDTRLSSFVTRTSGLPVYQLTGATCPSLNDPISAGVVTGSNVRSTDPGRARVTGRCADLGQFKAPFLRNFAVRAPYFHNASAATLDDVLTFYVVRFGLALTPRNAAT
jgi:hypothetical protein